MIKVLLLILILSGCNGQQKTKPITPNDTQSLPIVLPDYQDVSDIKSKEHGLYDDAVEAIYSDTNKRKKRIINGSKVYPQEIPWQVGIIVKGSNPILGQFCGGSIISQKWILTACHCVEGRKPDDIQVFSGSVDLGGKEALISDVNRIIRHKKYSDQTLDNDIALIELKKPLKFNRNINLIKIPNSTSENSIKPGMEVIVSGWGITETGKRSRSLKKVEVNIISENNCANTYGNGVTTNMLCAGLHEGGVRLP